MNKTFVWFGKVLALAALAGTAALAANAQVMGGSGGSGTAVAGTGTVMPGQTIAPGQTAGDAGFLQFNNLIVESVSGSEIMAANQVFYPMMSPASGPNGAAGMMQSSPAAAPQTSGTCYRFDSAGSTRGTVTACPLPPSSVAGGPAIAMPVMPTRLYRIEIDASTQLYLRDRTKAVLSDFASGDQINVFGYYNTDGSIQAYQVRDISKPAETQIMQLNNVSLVSISLDTNTLVVTQQNGPCYGFSAGGANRQSIACPLGIEGTTNSPALQNVKVPSAMMPIWGYLRKYVVKLDAQTILLDSNRTRLALSDLRAGDSLNVYGDTSDNGQTINADIVRDLSIPATASSYSGKVIQVNADGSFVIQTDSGATITVQSPIQVGATVNVTGVLDRLQNILSHVANILIGTGDGEILIKPAPVPAPVPMMGAPASPNR